MRTLAVLGGSGPFTASFIDALAATPELGLTQLHLAGRHAARREAMVAYARHRLPGCAVLGTASPEQAVDGAHAVVVQIRFGGMEGRAEAERAAAAMGCPADETLGPAGLHMALQLVEPTRALARLLAERASQAWILNLINPLSVSCHLLAAAHPRVIGVCELPHTTAQWAGDILGEPLDSWCCTGLNHRSFLHGLDQRGADALPGLVAALEARASDAPGGVPVAWLRELEALPTKYFARLRRPEPPGPSRAEALLALSDRVAAELMRDPERAPPSLSLRVTDWYAEGVVPLLRALWVRPAARIVNVPDASGLVEERLAVVSPTEIRPLGRPPLSPAAAAWVERVRAHERGVLACLDDRAAIGEALALDPLVQAAGALSRISAFRPPESPSPADR